MKNFNIDEFTMIYKTKVDEQNPVFLRFLEFIEDEKNIEQIRFFNDEYCIPPADLFTRLNKDLFDPIKESFMANKGEKQKLGAYFGYLFQFMLDNKYVRGKKIQVRFNEKTMYVLNSASAFVENKG